MRKKERKKESLINRKYFLYKFLIKEKEEVMTKILKAMIERKDRKIKKKISMQRKKERKTQKFGKKEMKKKRKKDTNK